MPFFFDANRVSLEAFFYYIMFHKNIESVRQSRAKDVQMCKKCVNLRKTIKKREFFFISAYLVYVGSKNVIKICFEKSGGFF